MAPSSKNSGSRFSHAANTKVRHTSLIARDIFFFIVLSRCLFSLYFGDYHSLFSTCLLIALDGILFFGPSILHLSIGQGEYKTLLDEFHLGMVGQRAYNAVGFEEAALTFVCKKIYTHLMGKDELPEFVCDTLYRDGDLHYIFMGEIEDVFGTIDE